MSNLMETSKEEMERVVVGRGSSHLVSHHVDTPGTVLRYTYIWVSGSEPTYLTSSMCDHVRVLDHVTFTVISCYFPYFNLAFTMRMHGYGKM